MVENMLWTFSKLNRQHLQNISFHLHKLRHLSPYSVSNCFYFYGRSKRLLLHPPIIIISTELQQTHIRRSWMLPPTNEKLKTGIRRQRICLGISSVSERWQQGEKKGTCYKLLNYSSSRTRPGEVW